MIIFKNNEELKELIVDGNIIINDDIECDFDINVDANIIAIDINANNINAHNIKAWDIKARDIIANDINAHNIKARDIKAIDINAHNIKARDINANDINANDINANDIKAINIKAWDINSWDINARDIKARDISYYAFCISYNKIICTSIKGSRHNSFHKCLDGELTIKEKLQEITIKNKKFMLTLSEINELKNQLKC